MTYRLRLIAALAVCMSAGTGYAGDSELPKLLIIGDSISIGYTPYVRQLLAGRAEVVHHEGNAQDTANGLMMLDEWLAADRWDVIHFNWGLWDMRYDNGFDSPSRVPIEQYEKNLRQLVARLKRHGAKLIWASTTPVPAGAARRIEGSEVLYNDVAMKIMLENGIEVNDLHRVASSRIEAYQQKANVHFLAAGSLALAETVVQKVQPLLRWRRHVIDESSRGADGVRLADVNGDGLSDIATGWEEGGITRVYLNPGWSKAKEEWPAVTVGRTASAEDAVFADLDEDGAVDVVACCEGSTKTLFVHWAPKGAGDYPDATKWKQSIVGDSSGKTAWMFCVPLQTDGVRGTDLVAGSKEPAGAVGWYEAPADARRTQEYIWHEISKAGWIMSVVAYDMDGDGDNDVLISDRKGGLRGVRWLENPGPDDRQKQHWENHFVGGRDWEVMFLRMGDMNKDGLDDILVAARQGRELQRILFYQRLDASGLRWKEECIAFPQNTGLAKGVAIGDIDCDGRDDIVLSCEDAGGGKSGVMWLRQGESMSKWDGFEISGPRGIKFDRIELLDLDMDGDPDVITCEERDSNSKGEKVGMGVFWYENPWANR